MTGCQSVAGRQEHITDKPYPLPYLLHLLDAAQASVNGSLIEGATRSDISSFSGAMYKFLSCRILPHLFRGLHLHLHVVWHNVTECFVAGAVLFCARKKTSFYGVMLWKSLRYFSVQTYLTNERVNGEWRLITVLYAAKIMDIWSIEADSFELFLCR